MKEQEVKDLADFKVAEDKANKDHQKNLKDNKEKIDQMFERLKKAELKSNQDVFDKYVVGEYRETVLQIIKILKFKTIERFM